MASSIVIGEDTASVAKAIQLKEMERTVAASGSGQTTIDKSIIKQQVHTVCLSDFEMPVGCPFYSPLFLIGLVWQY